MEETLLKNLNPKQREAVLATKGPVLIFAGPGSGKTATLTTRIANLMANGTPPERILAVTFTNKAAGEMRERVIRLLHSQPTSHQLPATTLPFIGTFHALAVRILRRHGTKIGFPERFTIFDTDDSLSLIKDILKNLDIPAKQFPPSMILHTISQLKNELIDPDQYAVENDISDFYPQRIHRIYTEYQQKLRKSGALDFDDLLMQTVKLFRTHPEILATYQEQYEYIHVDEYQDTNHTQYILIKELAQKHHNIAVVGDDAQAIYGFRGADFRNILNFEKDWPEARVVILDQNYRSTQIILDAAKGIIAKNRLQKEKSLWTERRSGEPISIISTEDERAEAMFIVREAKKLMQKNHTLGDMVVLYRTNAQSRALEEAFVRNNFPYTIIGGTGFYQRREIKDILAYLRFLINPNDELSLKRIINIPPRGIGKRTVESYLATQSSTLSSDRVSPPISRGLKSIESFENIIIELKKEMAEKNASAFLLFLVQKINYQRYLEEATDQGEDRWENVRELLSLAQTHDELPAPEGIVRLLEDTALMTDADRTAANGKTISLMTLHAAKGLEFPIVFMVGFEEGILPHSRALLSAHELEEERRLCYVGLTRAKDKVYISFALRRMFLGSLQANMPSRFLGEMPQDIIKFLDHAERVIDLDE